MDRREIFERNITALCEKNPRTASRFSGKGGGANRYRFLESRCGDLIPALAASGSIQPLHSTIDPKREAQRLASTITGDTGFVVFMGLGGGFAPEAALQMTKAHILVIDFDIDGIAELFSYIDYTKLLCSDRFSILIDPAENEIKNFLLDYYRPAICGGIKTIPLRSRTEPDFNKFDSAAAAVHEAIENVAADYSVQAHFGSRWFSNIIRNIAAEKETENFSAKITVPVHEAAIVAAGPSLDQQIPLLAECKSKNTFIICSDTALPVLLYHGIEPDAALSIDCQHISYYHFLGCNLRAPSNRNIPLFLDIASPPPLSRLSLSPLFFSSGHPLALYVSQYWRSLPCLDASGGNVTYACLSLAQSVGARRITLFGADFSYVQSRTYARGTYIYPFFEKKQNRFSSLEALFSAFLYRSPFLPRESGKDYYETAQLRFYRKKLEEKAAVINAQITAARGQGAPISLPVKIARNAEGGNSGIFAPAKAKMSGIDFLERYRAKIAALPAASDTGYYQQTPVFTTLLPFAAAVKHRNPSLNLPDLIEETKRRCTLEIDRVLSA